MATHMPKEPGVYLVPEQMEEKHPPLTEMTEEERQNLPLAADTPGVEGMGSGSPPPYSLAWWRSQNFPPDVPVLQHNGCSDGGLTAHHHEEVNGAKSGRPILSNVGSSADCLHGSVLFALHHATSFCWSACS